MAKIDSKVLRLKKDAEVSPGMPLSAGQEIEIANDVVFINGGMLPPSMQSMFYGWIINNPSLFEDDTRDWGR